MRFKDQVIWITGASSGIGMEMARQLSAAGAKLILTARRQEILEQLCLQLPGPAVALPADLTDAAFLPSLTEAACACFGRVDSVVFSAGVSQRAFAGDTAAPVLRQLMELNFFAQARLTQLLLPIFRKQGSGQIVALSSMAGLMGFPRRSGYAAAKHALKGYFETLQAEADESVYILLVYPGRIHTPISLSALRADGSPHGAMDEGQLNGIPVERCAAKIIRGMARGQQRLLIARDERLLWWLWFFLPALYRRIARSHGS